MRAIVLILLLAAGALRAAVPLVASYDMEPDPAHPERVIDAGGLQFDATLRNPRRVAREGHGQAAAFTEPGTVLEIAPQPWLDTMVTRCTFTAWVKIDTLSTKDDWTAGKLFWKGGNAGLQLALQRTGHFFFHGFWGGGWYQNTAGSKMPLNAWTHLAFVFDKGGDSRIYVDGRQVYKLNTPYQVRPIGDPWRVGGAEWTGALDDLHVYAAALTPEQVAQDRDGTLATRRAMAADFPEVLYPVQAALGRFDHPAPFSRMDGRMKLTARRVPGPDAVDWPTLTVTIPGRAPAKLFADGPTQVLEVSLAERGREKPLFRQAYDNTVSTGQWFRALPWRWGQFYIYSTDNTVRTSAFDFELWAFPVKIAGEEELRDVTLTLGGDTLYRRTEPLHSLTLLLPANLTGVPYALTVNGRGPVTFNVGLQPVTLGAPRDVPLPVDLVLPGAGPRLTVRSLDTSEAFAYQKAWDDDLLAMAQPSAPLPVPPPALLVPRSPVTVFTAALTAGMSSGQLSGANHQARFAGSTAAYADHLAQVGFDLLFEAPFKDTILTDKGTLDTLFPALAARGVRLGLIGSGDGGWGQMGHPNMAFHAATLPEWHAPVFREYALLTQRYGRYPNFAGVLTGADNAGYVPYWDWAPPIPNRPWGRSYLQFQQGRVAKTPVGPALGVGKDYEVKGTQREFVDYIRRYNATFAQLGYFAQAVRAVHPNAVFTTGSFGSSPGVGGRGGWPWASIPATMYRDVPVQTAYDWNERGASKPLHNVALIDRLRSTDPDKPTWTIIDDFGLFFGREARQRAYALVLTRGVMGIGTNFLPHATGAAKAQPDTRAQTVADYTELFAWVHRYSGAYALMRPVCPVGILYVHEQAISRSIVGGEASPDALAHGSHEGKTTEALFLCHAAGIPARIVTPEELTRGLPADMHALLLVGLNRFDDTWAWYEGLEAPLKRFAARGGRLLVDDESVAPLPAEQTGLSVAAYVTQGDTDATPLLLARNAENITRLRAALPGLPAPLAASADPTVWALPTRADDVDYVTVVNQGCVDGQNASKVVKPQTGALRWATTRPIYDVRLRRRITPEEAAACDLTTDGFRWYALPPAPVAAPTVKLAVTEGWYTATVTVANPKPIAGIPVELAVDGAGTVYGATGRPIRLPLHQQTPGRFTVTATELLSGLTATATVTVPVIDIPLGKPSIVAQPAAVAAFAVRTAPLTVALTPEQAADAKIAALAEKLAAYYRGKGRAVRIRRIAPNDVVTSLQPMAAVLRYPQWATVPTDLVLFGTPATNLLLFDQARAGLLPAPPVAVCRTCSPFVGEYDALNLLGADAPSLAQAVAAVMQ
jgi:hypothetical protein